MWAWEIWLHQGKWQKLEKRWTVHLKQTKLIFSYVQYQARPSDTGQQKCILKAVSKLTDSFHDPRAGHSCCHSFGWMSFIFNLRHQSGNNSQMYQGANFMDVVLPRTDWPDVLVKEGSACSFERTWLLYSWVHWFLHAGIIPKKITFFPHKELENVWIIHGNKLKIRFILCKRLKIRSGLLGAVRCSDSSFILATPFAGFLFSFDTLKIIRKKAHVLVLKN